MRWPKVGGGGGLKVLEIPLEKISTNPYQPRRDFDKQSLEELAESIRRYGVVQPIIVRPLGQHFQLVAGERRLKASRMAGKPTIPSLVRELEDEAVMEIAFIENMHRRQLNKVEEVEGYMRIAQELGLKDPEAMAKRLGQSVVGLLEKNWILAMPPLLKRALVSQMIDEDLAKALVSVQNEDKLKKILQGLYSGKIKREDVLARVAGKKAESAGTQKDPGEKLIHSLKAAPSSSPLDLALACFGVMREIIHAYSKKGLKVDIRDIKREEEFGVEVVFRDPAKKIVRPAVVKKVKAPASSTEKKVLTPKKSVAPPPEVKPVLTTPREETKKFQDFLKARGGKS